MASMKTNVLHFRTWRRGRSVAACRDMVRATTTPNAHKVNCPACQATLQLGAA